jgi:hypothetical protein
MALLVKMADGSPALLKYQPTTHVVRLVGLSYSEARQRMLGLDVTEGDSAADSWARTVARLDGATELAVTP